MRRKNRRFGSDMKRESEVVGVLQRQECLKVRRQWPVLHGLAGEDFLEFQWFIY
jgi:hypothetical protein